MDKRHTRYAREFKKEAVRKAMMRGPRTLAEVAEEMGVGLNTLKTWMRLDREKIRGKAVRKGKSPGKRNRKERLEILMGAHGMEGAELSGYCREAGVYIHDLAEWRREFEEEPGGPERMRIRELEDERRQLERDLRNKEKALAETVALLVLKKKMEILWEEEADMSVPGNGLRR